MSEEVSRGDLIEVVDGGSSNNTPYAWVGMFAVVTHVNTYQSDRWPIAACGVSDSLTVQVSLLEANVIIKRYDILMKDAEK